MSGQVEVTWSERSSGLRTVSLGDVPVLAASCCFEVYIGQILRQPVNLKNSTLHRLRRLSASGRALSGRAGFLFILFGNVVFVHSGKCSVRLHLRQQAPSAATTARRGPAYSGTARRPRRRGGGNRLIHVGGLQ